MLLKIIISMLSLINVESFTPIYNPVSNPVFNPLQLTESIKSSNLDTSYLVADKNLIDNIIEIKFNNKYLGRIIVEQISSFLPKVDSIGHNVLHANNELISYILNMDVMPDESKKNLILLTIKIAQMGDDAGSHLLQLYYDIVEKCL